MDAHDAAPGLSARGVTFAAHTFAGWTHAGPEAVWTALTDPGATPAFLYGLAAHSTWIPGDPVCFSYDGLQVTGRVLCAERNERLSYVLQSGPQDPPVYLTWLIRPGPGGCTIGLHVDEIDTADSREDAEDVWLPVLAALQRLADGGLVGSRSPVAYTAPAAWPSQDRARGLSRRGIAGRAGRSRRTRGS